ncbi:thioredoxin family protein [Serratia marcescens]|nr:thioredoxin family protein [Serratia marcescens]MBN5258655.1 thioredoxin family protein [Serratia marcescens]MBN5356254.1 thioredoxin family protein [Serratia marcescens]HEJ8044237.1 thioredoxin family protein [Serratia marcescens]
MTKAVFYHAGCPVCVSAEQQLLGLLSDNVQVEVVHLGERPTRVSEAERLGVQSVPALVADGQVLHINFGAALADLKG